VRKNSLHEKTSFLGICKKDKKNLFYIFSSLLISACALPKLRLAEDEHGHGGRSDDGNIAHHSSPPPPRQSPKSQVTRYRTRLCGGGLVFIEEDWMEGVVFEFQEERWVQAGRKEAAAAISTGHIWLCFM